MNLTKRDLIVLLNGLSLIVEVSHQQDKSFPNYDQLAKITEARRMAQELIINSPITFGELNNLFTRITEQAEILEMNRDDRDLASLPPTSDYIH